ncbi:MAG: asparagine synthase-related protein [Armatimonadota bacterium]|nr:asparagine synthase-related protein [Armatimonadota bacterium]
MIVLLGSGGATPASLARRPDGMVALYEGAIYNVSELSEMVAAPPGTGPADMILALYEADGVAGIGRVDGAGVLVIWDTTRDTLLVFRDRYGQVPLFHTERDGFVIWSDDIRPLLGVDGRTINIAALDFFLTAGYIPNPWTVVREISKVPPGHVVRYRGANAVVEPYWRPTWRPKWRMGAPEVTRRLRDLFEGALARRAIPGERVGVLIGGGVDSALVAAGLRKLVDASVETFTVRYLDYRGPDNEYETAGRIARSLEIPHHEIIVGPGEVARDLRRMVWAYGEPFTYGMHSFWLEDVVRAGVRTLATGHGPHTLVVVRHPLLLHAERLAWLPAPVRGTLRATVPGLLRLASPRRARGAARLLDLAAASAVERFLGPLVTYAFTPESVRRQLYQDPGRCVTSRRAVEDLLASSVRWMNGETVRDQVDYLGLTTNGSEHVSRWYACWAREHRLRVVHPYFDNDLADFSARLRRQYADKDDLRRLAATVLPPWAAYAPKYAQSIPIGVWLRGPLRALASDCLEPARLAHVAGLDGQAVRRLVDRHALGEDEHGWTIWALLTFAVWCDLFLTGQGASCQ